MAMGVEECKALGAMLSGIAQFAAALAAGWFFIRRMKRGHFIPNLSLEIDSIRAPVAKHHAEHLVVRVRLKKGDRGTLQLLRAIAEVSYATQKASISLSGIDFLEPTELIKRDVNRDWRHKLSKRKHLNLTMGEEMQIAGSVPVPCDAICQIVVCIYAEQLGERKVGRWQSSHVSLPAQPQVFAISEPLSESS